MKKGLLYILIMTCSIFYAQNSNEHVREINYGVLGVLDDYSNASKLWGTSDANNFIRLFESDAEVVNDISQSSYFGQKTPVIDYIDVIRDGRSSSMIGVDLNVLQMNAISGDSKAGSVTVIAEKIISTKFKNIGVLEGEEFGDKKQILQYDNQSFILKFDINFVENERLIELLNKQKTGDINDYEEDELLTEPKFIFKIKNIQLHEKKNKVLPVLTYIKDFPYLSKGKLISLVFSEEEIEEENVEIRGCTNPNALNFKPSATEDDGSCLLIQLNQNSVDQKGNQIRYFLYDGDKNSDVFTLNNQAYSKGKLEDDIGDYQRLSFKQRIDYKISYNNSISKSGVSVDKSAVINTVEYNEKLNLSMGLYPISKPLGKAGIGYKLGFKISSVISEITMLPYISPYSQIANDAQLGGIGLNYNRLYDVTILNEVVKLNRNSFYLSAQFNYRIYSLSDNLNAYVYSGLNIAIVNLRNASYSNNGFATILGEYSINEEDNQLQDYDEDPNVTFGAGVFDFGSHNLIGEGDINTSTTSLDLSSISFGLEVNYQRYGIYFEIDTELIPSKDLFKDKNDIILESPIDEQLRSVTSIINTRTRNTYFSIGLNFKF
tara:strand:- start:364 stop:2175 length:1812 start_codon:yes stop_codon:yes gene_type:complete